MAKRVLLVDDEPAIVQPFKMYLAHEGYEVEEAYDGQEGLEKAHSAKPDIIVLDVVMPQMSGKEVLRRLKEDPATAHIPVIMLTGAATDPEDVSESWLQGAETHLSKPCEPSELSLWIDRILKGLE
ncbi:MAG: PleD family two-component system response regulator [Armatimonadota bacterium]